MQNAGLLSVATDSLILVNEAREVTSLAAEQRRTLLVPTADSCVWSTLQIWFSSIPTVRVSTTTLDVLHCIQSAQPLSSRAVQFPNCPCCSLASDPSVSRYLSVKFEGPCGIPNDTSATNTSANNSGLADATPSPSPPQQPILLSSAPSSSSPSNAWIIGPVLGGIGGFLVLVAFFLYKRRRDRRRKSDVANLPPLPPPDDRLPGLPPPGTHDAPPEQQQQQPHAGGVQKLKQVELQHHTPTPPRTIVDTTKRKQQHSTDSKKSRDSFDELFKREITSPPVPPLPDKALDFATYGGGESGSSGGGGGTSPPRATATAIAMTPTGPVRVSFADLTGFGFKPQNEPTEPTFKMQRGASWVCPGLPGSRRQSAALGATTFIPDDNNGNNNNHRYSAASAAGDDVPVLIQPLAEGQSHARQKPRQLIGGQKPEKDSYAFPSYPNGPSPSSDQLSHCVVNPAVQQGFQHIVVGVPIGPTPGKQVSLDDCRVDLGPRPFSWAQVQSSFLAQGVNLLADTLQHALPSAPLSSSLPRSSTTASRADHGADHLPVAFSSTTSIAMTPEGPISVVFSEPIGSFKSHLDNNNNNNVEQLEVTGSVTFNPPASRCNSYAGDVFGIPYASDMPPMPLHNMDQPMQTEREQASELPNTNADTEGPPQPALDEDEENPPFYVHPAPPDTSVPVLQGLLTRPACLPNGSPGVATPEGRGVASVPTTALQEQILLFQPQSPPQVCISINAGNASSTAFILEAPLSPPPLLQQKQQLPPRVNDLRLDVAQSLTPTPNGTAAPSPPPQQRQHHNDDDNGGDDDQQDLEANNGSIHFGYNGRHLVL